MTGEGPIQSMIQAGGRAVLRSLRKGLAGGKKSKGKATPRYVRGVYKGNFVRRRVPTNRRRPTVVEVPKLPPPLPAVAPKPFKNVTPPPPSSPPSLTTKPPGMKKAGEATSVPPTGGHGGARGGGGGFSFYERCRAWLVQNGPVLVLNFGSVCTLLGFTRSDVLELRGLSMTGSVSFVVYQSLQPPPIRWLPIAWSTLFASVNGYKIYRIVEERKGGVSLDEHEEEIFVEHFMPHGVTPKQFERILRAAEPMTVKKDDAIMRQGDDLDAVYLIVRGTTRANIMGRRLTAASSTPGNRDTKVGGDSGAWVGEMAFLESLWRREQEEQREKKLLPLVKKKISMQRRAGDDRNAPDGNKPSTAAADDVDAPDGKKQSTPVSAAVAAAPPPASTTTPAPPRLRKALYTTVAADDCEVLRWSHEDLARLMRSSTDMRAAMTRAMTAAIVGKVINFTVAKTSGIPTWSTWLDDWKHAGARVNVDRPKAVPAYDDDNELDDDDDDLDEEYDDDDDDSLLATESVAGRIRRDA